MPADRNAPWDVPSDKACFAAGCSWCPLAEQGVRRVIVTGAGSWLGG